MLSMIDDGSESFLNLLLYSSFPSVQRAAPAVLKMQRLKLLENSLKSLTSSSIMDAAQSLPCAQDA